MGEKKDKRKVLKKVETKGKMKGIHLVLMSASMLVENLVEN